MVKNCVKLRRVFFFHHFSTTFPPLLVALFLQNAIKDPQWVGWKCSGVKNIFYFQTSACLWGAARSSVSGDFVNVSGTLLSFWRQNHCSHTDGSCGHSQLPSPSPACPEWCSCCHSTATGSVLSHEPAPKPCWRPLGFGLPSKEQGGGSVLLGTMKLCHQQIP